ncbi:hypothetical protein JTB14_033600 [Gonioctena quinquepunctata]|nr:hypothetical protein JTB14_033600 [Gonioctena quinquepunctata]
MAGIFGDCLMEPMLLDGNLRGASYLELLDECVYPQLVDIIGNDDRYWEDHWMFQQDGAPPHFAHPVGRFLDRMFPGYWIGRRGHIK